MADTLQLAKAERKFDTLRNVRVEALVDMLANPVAFLAHLAFLPMFVKQKMSTLGPADSY